MFSYEQRRVRAFVKERALDLKYQEVPTGNAAVNYGINALAVIGAAVFLTTIGEGIAEATGLSQTFVGTILIAFSTSLPEVVVSFAAVRLGAIDLPPLSALGMTRGRDGHFERPPPPERVYFSPRSFAAALS